jgi:hypothetical protein
LPGSSSASFARTTNGRRWRGLAGRKRGARRAKNLNALFFHSGKPMFQRKTVFVLGAGASCEVGMPTGAQLAARISGLLEFRWDGDGNFKGNRHGLSFFQRYASNLQFARQIAEGIKFSNSIDEYIDRRKNPMIERIGKLAIAHEILCAEDDSYLYVDPSKSNGLETIRVAAAWYLKLAHILFRFTDTRGIDHLFRNLSFINFNYDRCLEQFFRFAVRDAYSVDAANADALVATLKHLRPYGSIGPLQTVANPGGIAYGCSPHTPDMDAIVGRIKTYTEQVDTEAADDLKKEFASAHTVIFLGFGFHEQNMLLLAPNAETNIRAVLATKRSFRE